MFKIQPLKTSPLRVPALDARSFYFELHQTEDSKHFSKFMNRLSALYTQGVDFIKLPSGGEFPNRKDYAITIEVAKHMALLSETQNGKAYRKYLIDFEESNKPLKLNVLESAPLAIEMAKAFGFTGNQALLSADKATKALTGYSPLALMGQTQLISENKDVHMTVTELGSELNLKASEVNNLLRDQGFQEKIGMVMGKKGKLIGGHWKPTDKGTPHAEYLDTGKKHSDGTPIQQIKWYSSILSSLDK